MVLVVTDTHIRRIVMRPPIIRQRSDRAARAVCSVLFAFVLVFAPAEAAFAVSVASGPTTVVNPTMEYSTGAQYTFSSYRTSGVEQCTGCQITFPAGTNVAAATAVSPAGTVTVSGQTVTITFTNRIPASTTFSVVVGGVTNPAGGTYSVGNITFNTLLFGLIPTTGNAGTGGYTIASGHITLTIQTPNAGQSVDFGAIDPGVTTAPRSVTVTVNSSSGYTISRSVAGDATRMGLAVSGNANGTKPAGTASFTDSFTLTPPWTTDPGVPLVATVTYTVTQ